MFFEFAEALECLPSFKIFFYDFSEVSWCSKIFLLSCTSSKMSAKLLNIFQTHLEFLEGSKCFCEVVEGLECLPSF